MKIPLGRKPTEEEKHQLTLEGLADVDAGRVIPDEEVKAWVKCLGTANPLPVPKHKIK
jgi:predicted transcriptional regulator